MKILFDTSMLVAAMVESHPHHTLAFPWLQRVKQRLDEGVVAAHTLAELYAVLTRLPVHPIVTLNESDFRRVHPALADRVISPHR